VSIDVSTPVLILGGRENSTAVARNLGRLGVPIRVAGEEDCAAMRSRFCRQRFVKPAGESPQDYWRRLLLSESRELDGHLLFACCDDSLEFITENRDALSDRYVLEDFSAELRGDLLDKMRTLELARETGVPAPRHWSPASVEELTALKSEITYPVMIKPLRSHSFAATFGRKLFIIEDSFEELIEKFEVARRHGHEVMVVEMIPGPDDLLCSYYTFIDPAGTPLYHFTKRVIRRWPVNRGGGCHHVTEWVPDAAELGLKFFQAIGWRGTANIEFKRDPRDGQLKIIEVNSRFTAAHRLVVASGAPIDRMIYCKLTGQNVEGFDGFAQDMRMWYPLRDFFAYLELRSMGKLSFWGWLRSVMFKRMVLPDLDLTDPGPSLLTMRETAAGLARRLTKNRSLANS
jgi:predicted ATP-grasp superfamily ATP-dependent carboligase